MTAPYLDTSARAKWYLNEARSPDVEAFLCTCVHAQVTPVPCRGTA